MPPTKSPGPANYSARPLVGYKDHDFNSQKRRGPQWTFGINPKTSVEYKSPGPATSNIQNFTRFGRAFSQASTMYKRPKDLKADPNPGPTHSVTQTCIYKNCDPKYSIWLKTKPLSVDQGPGPNGSATPADVYKSRAPKYPMFSKLKELTADKCPGPNSYDSGIPKSKVLKQSAAFTHRWQTADPLSNKDKNPGPAKYGLMTHNPFDKCPAFTMRRRYSEFVYVPIVPMDNC